MSRIVTSGNWFSQPPYYPGVNPSYASSLCFLWAPYSEIPIFMRPNFIKNTIDATKSNFPSKSISSDGSGYAVTSTNYFSWKRQSDNYSAAVSLPVNSDATIIIKVNRLTMGTGNPGFFRTAVASNGISTFTSNGTSRRPTVYVNGTAVINAGSGPQWEENANHVFSLQVKSGELVQVGWNGIIHYSQTTSVTTDYYNDNGIFNWGYQALTAESIRGDWQLIAVFPTFLSDECVKSLMLNPWQLFAPWRQQFFYDPAAAAPPAYNNRRNILLM